MPRAITIDLDRGRALRSDARFDDLLRRLGLPSRAQPLNEEARTGALVVRLPDRERVNRVRCDERHVLLAVGAIGHRLARMPRGTLILKSSLPLRASSAKNSPVSLPWNTRSPAVTRFPDWLLPAGSCCHTSSPVIGSYSDENPVAKVALHERHSAIPIRRGAADRCEQGRPAPPLLATKFATHRTMMRVCYGSKASGQATTCDKGRCAWGKPSVSRSVLQARGGSNAGNYASSPYRRCRHYRRSG